MNGVEPCGCFVGTMVNTVGGLAWKLFSLGTMMLQCQTLNGLSGGIIIVGHNTKTNIITRALPSVGACDEVKDPPTCQTRVPDPYPTGSGAYY